MSLFIRTLNQIKIHRQATWLTPSQQESLAQLKAGLRVPGTVNLCGPTGVGKTFLGWILAEELSYSYFTHFSHFQQVERVDTSGVIIDNCQSDRQTHRTMLKALNFRHINFAVLISRQLIYDYTYFVELSLTPVDQTKVWDNLITIGYYGKTTETPNLWLLVNPHL